MSKRALIVEDDSNIAELLRLYLGKDGFEVMIASDGGKAESSFDLFAPDVVLLDIMLPVKDGWQVCRDIRKKSSTPIIMLPAKGETNDKVNGLEVGADDYVTKPFSPAELTARIDALFRRTGGEQDAEETGEIRQGPFRLNTRNRTLEKNGERVRLTQIEISIIKYFIDNPGKALSREDILNEVWGRDYFGELKIVDVNVRRLRLKIEDDAQEPKYISTVWGYGYKWNA